MARVLVTGATGFVGLPVVEHLLEAGHEVTCVIRPGSQERLGGLAVEAVTSEDLFAEPHEWWAQVCEGVDTIIHVAWDAEPGKYLDSDKNLDCLSGTLTMARGAARAGVRRFVGVGTCFEYDLSDGHVSVDTPIAPTTLYAAAKAATCSTLKVYLAQQGMEFLWARLFYLYGPREDSRRLVPYLRSCLEAGQIAELGSGKAVKDYLDVRDAARMIVSDALSSRQGASNICSGVGISIRALAEQIADDYDRRDLLHFGAREDNPADPLFVVGFRKENEL